MIHPYILNISLSVILVVLFKRLFPWVFNPLTPVKVNGHTYLVVNKPDKHAVATKLDRLRVKLSDIVKRMNDRTLNSKFKALLSENAQGGIYTSYTVNKGEHIYMCMRNGESLIDDNTLMFVALHELAHVMTKSIGHKADFRENFKLLLKEAEKQGYYVYTPYHIKPQPYCGTRISSTF